MRLQRWMMAVVLGLVLLLPLPAGAERVDGPRARAIVEGFLQERDAARGIDASREIEQDGELLAHLHRLEPCGFVIVSGDDRLPPVLAYDFDSTCPNGAESPLLDLVRADVRSRLAALPATPSAVTERWLSEWDRCLQGEQRSTRFEQWPPQGTTPTGGWLAENWTQNAPYNANCPLDLAHGGGRSLAGCPAVAMAMILNYHATIQGTAFDSGDRYYHSFSGNSYWIPDAAVQYGFPSFATLNAALETLSLHWSQGTSLTHADKAALVFACGTACRQVYSASVSGTYGVDQAYDAFQRFSFTDCRLVDESDPGLYPDLAAEMQYARPAHLAVVDPGWTMGHNLVIDGYNTDDYYHLNFGWGGAYNGWYHLPEGIPYGLTVIEGVILDIVPATTAVSDPPALVRALNLTSTPNPIGSRVVSVSFSLPERGQTRLGLYDAQGRLQSLLLEGDASSGLQTIDWNPGDLPAGVYWLRLASESGSAARRVVVQP